ncbi:MAG: nucleotidyltransferase domain-containing protein [bacterium]|nr:nucleotidyltransferase domain-containing protein [bacterium]
MTHRAEVTEILNDIVKRLVEGYAPQKVILFGSYARGEASEDSDIDLLIIKDTEKPPIERWQEVKRLLRDRNRRVSVSPLVYTSEEIARRLSVRDFFIEEVLEEGIVLYDG